MGGASLLLLNLYKSFNTVSSVILFCSGVVLSTYSVFNRNNLSAGYFLNRIVRLISLVLSSVPIMSFRECLCVWGIRVG